MSRGVLWHKMAITALAMAVAVAGCHAATFHWVITPGAYSDIRIVSSQLLMCQRGNQWDLVTSNGQTVVSDVDFIDNFYENKAVVARQQNGKYRLLGYINATDMNYNAFPSSLTLYATKYSHFSEGLIAVQDGNGRQGFADAGGRVVVPCRYQWVAPFCEGVAVVRPKASEALYISKNGTVKTISHHDGRLNFATSYSGGTALVGNNGDYALIDRNGQKVRKPSDYEVTNFRNLLQESDNNNYTYNNSPHHSVKLSAGAVDAGLISYQSGGRYGITQGSTRVTEAVFDNLGEFINGRAVARVGSRTGVIELVNGSFSGSLETTSVSLKAGERPISNNAVIKVPDGMDVSKLSVTAEGCSDWTCHNSGNTITCRFIPSLREGADTHRVAFIIKDQAEIPLYSYAGQIDVKWIRKPVPVQQPVVQPDEGGGKKDVPHKRTGSITIGNIEAGKPDAQGKITISARVTNTTSSPANGTIACQGRQQSFTVSAGKSVTAAVTVSNATKNSKTVTASVACGTASRSATVVLKGFTTK